MFWFRNQQEQSKQQTKHSYKNKPFRLKNHTPLILPSEHVKKTNATEKPLFWFPPSIPNSQFVQQPLPGEPSNVPRLAQKGQHRSLEFISIAFLLALTFRSFDADLTSSRFFFQEHDLFDARKLPLLCRYCGLPFCDT